jgi:hypothetical protein
MRFASENDERKVIEEQSFLAASLKECRIVVWLDIII